MYNCLHTIPACDRRTDGQTSCHGIVKTMTGLPYTEENMWHIKPFQQYAAWHTDRQTEFPHQYHASALLCWHTIKTWLLICMKHKPEVNTVCLPSRLICQVISKHAHRLKLGRRRRLHLTEYNSKLPLRNVSPVHDDVSLRLQLSSHLPAVLLGSKSKLW